jgi:hypothetical protein
VPISLWEARLCGRPASGRIGFYGRPGRFAARAALPPGCAEAPCGRPASGRRIRGEGGAHRADPTDKAVPISLWEARPRAEGFCARLATSWIANCK